MSQSNKRANRKTQPTKKAHTQGESQTQALLDPPQIKQFIRRYFRGQPEQADKLWSLILGNDHLLRAWKVYAKAGIGKEFWEATWHRDIGLEADEWSAVSEMHRNPHHLMRLCRYPLFLSLAYDVFAGIGSMPEEKAVQVSHFEDALLSCASEKMGDLMDAGHSPAEFWPPDNWWMYQVWGDIAVKLAGARDPIRVAQWIADVNVLVAARCLTESGYLLSLKELDPDVFDLGDIAFRELATPFASDIEFNSSYYRRSALSALIARLANPDYPVTMERLTSLVEQSVPELFHATAYGWLSIIGDEHLQEFFGSIGAFRMCAEEYSSLMPDQRTAPLLLHINDERAMLELERILLSRAFGEGLLMVSITGGAYALIIASTLLPNLVLTDVLEPGMSGFDFAAYLKKNPVTQTVPFAFRSATMGHSENVKRGMELGARACLATPFSPQELVYLIQNVMQIEVQSSR